MSYQIDYGSFRYDQQHKCHQNGKFLVGFLVLLTVIITILHFPSELKYFRQKLMPFFEPNVQQAFGEMVTRIDEGEKFSHAASAFCREIIFEEA